MVRRSNGSRAAAQAKLGNASSAPARARPQPPQRDPPAAEGHGARRTARPLCGARGIGDPLRPALPRAIGLHHRVQHPLPGVHAPLKEVLLDAGEHLDHRQRHLQRDHWGRRRLVGATLRARLSHGGSFRVGLVATVPTGTAKEPPLFSAQEFNRFWDIPLADGQDA